MTDGERELILRRLTDRELLPFDGVIEIPPAAIAELSERERAVLAEEIKRHSETLLARADALLRAKPPEISGFAGLKAQVKLRWASFRLSLAKKGAGKK